MRDRAADSPWILPLLGGGIGALVGRAFSSKVQERRDSHAWRGYDDRAGWRGDSRGLSERYEVWAGEDAGVAPLEADAYTGLEVEHEGEGGIKGRAADLKDEASTRASELKDRLTGKASGMRDDLRSRTDEWRSRASELKDRVPSGDELRSRAEQNPAFFAFGALAIGALFGLLLPVTEGERRALAPAKEKMREAGEQAAQKVSDKVSETIGGGSDASRDEGAPSPITPGQGAGAGPDILAGDPLH